MQAGFVRGQTAGPGREMAQAVVAAQEAGEILLSHYRTRDRLTVASKRAGDFVSEADLAAESHLRARLLGLWPDDGWLGGG